MSTPLLDKVRQYKNIGMRFHTPSHANILDDELYSNTKYDITELDFSDNLLQPTGVILELERELEKIYGSKRCLILTNGATCGNFIAINVLKKYGKILVCPNCHKSIYNAVKLFNVNADFMENAEFLNGLPKPIDLKDIESAIDCGGYGSIVITSPTYFGSTVSKNLIIALKEKGVKVFVDQAHGGHFVYSKLLPQSLSCIADLTVDSLHKTLPVYTGGALLHINNDDMLLETEFYHSIIHSSSPSYVTMCSIDYTQDLFNREGERLYLELYNKLKLCKLDIFKVVKTDDFSRLVIDTFPYSAEKAAKLLEEDGVYIETYYKNFLVLILSPLNVESLTPLFIKLDNVGNILKETICGEKDKKTKYNFENDNSLSHNDYKDKTDFKDLKFEFVKLEECENRLSYSEVGVYPPGIPLVKSFDRITKEQKNYLLDNRNILFGLVSNKICVIVER